MKHIVLLGDSIFDNSVYVAGGPDVVAQVRMVIPNNWQATLTAVDGDISTDVRKQIENIPKSATHLIVSAGGNDALQRSRILEERARNVGEALKILSAMCAEFASHYRKMLNHLLSLDKPLAVCTIYDPNFSEEYMQVICKTALMIYNDCILREAFVHGLPVIDLRLMFTAPEDYANDIEPAVQGGAKIANTILNLVTHHDFSSRQTVIY